jgi:hypothetical protein
VLEKAESGALVVRGRGLLTAPLFVLDAPAVVAGALL